MRVAINDFSTGYASLSYLRLHAFDVIKIDHQFIHDLNMIPGGHAIVQAILGTAIGLMVTAEGFGTRRQLGLLIEDDCLEVQGFLMACPMTAAQLENLLETNITVVGLR